MCLCVLTFGAVVAVVVAMIQARAVQVREPDIPK
jgi:hypothetical protein